MAKLRIAPLATVLATALALVGAGCAGGDDERGGRQAALAGQGAGSGGTPAPNDLTTVDSAGTVGTDTSITIGADGFGLISYRDLGTGALKVAHCANAACSASATATVDNTANVQFTSITIGADGLGLISYFDNTNADLKVAHCVDAACSSATAAAVDSAGSVGWYSSITIGADGLGLISYYDNTNADLKVAHCADVACSSATAATLDSAGSVGFYTSIALGADGLGLISYYDGAPNYDLKVAHCSNPNCTTATTAILDSAGSVGSFSSVTVGADWLGLISYYDQTDTALKVAHCGNAACSTATTATLDSAGSVGLYSSVAVGADGLGLISYYDQSQSSGALKVAHCGDIACSAATTATVDRGSVGTQTSATVGADGRGLISYYDAGTHKDLKVAHCVNEVCASHFRRR